MGEHLYINPGDLTAFKITSENGATGCEDLIEDGGIKTQLIDEMSTEINRDYAALSGLEGKNGS